LRGKYVPTRFPTKELHNGSQLAFIGEAPARNEVRIGEPFVGLSGQLLNTVLQNYQVDRDSVLLSNAASCHYPDSMKKLPPEAVDACRPRLVAELEAANVDTAVIMGNSAVRAVLEPSVAKQGITKLRVGPPKILELPRSGDLADAGSAESVKISTVLTFHPAYCLRSQAMFPLMLSDINKALADKLITRWYEPEIVVIDDSNEAIAMLRDIFEESQEHGVVVDTESGHDKDTSFGRDDGPYGKVLCVGIGPANRDVVYVFTDNSLTCPQAKDELKRVLRGCGIHAQNGKYDIGVLMKFLEEEEPFPLKSDTMLMSYSLYEVGGIHGLDYMGRELLGTPDWKGEIKPYVTKEQGYGSIPRDLLYVYNAFDVHCTRILREYFLNLVAEQGLEQINAFLLRASHMLTKVEARGIGFDPEVARELANRFDGEIRELESQLPFNPRSWQQVKAWLEEHGIKTDSTDEDHLIAIREHRRTPEEVREKIDLVLKTRHVSKMKGTYITGPLEKLSNKGRVHTSFMLTTTATGRTSSRKPNLQNIPRTDRLKAQFIPSPDKLFIKSDYSQAEFRVLTWLAKDEDMRRLFNDPTVDIFDTLCERMFPGFRSMPKTDRQELRVLIKTFAYGVSYGRTAEGIAMDPDFNMSVKEAQKQMDLFNAQIPTIKAFQQDVIRRVHQGEDLVNPFGRHRRFYLITDFNRKSVENEAMASLPQAIASDMCLESACRLSEKGLHIVNLIHDAILAEVSPDEAEEVGELMDRVMCEVAREITDGYVEFRTDWKVGKNWLEVG
jgi:uracil-DNA glycosylase family 4